VRKSVIVLALEAALIVLAVPAAAGMHDTYVTYDCAHTKMEPRSILFACGDGNFFAKHLDWRRWHPHRAVGEGEFHQNACHPDCASGTFHEKGGRIILHGRMWCSNVHRYVFAHARIRFDRRLIGRKRVRFGLACPMHG
jgi:hypothetical protein